MDTWIPEATTGFQPTINSQVVYLALGSEIRYCRQGTLLNTKQEFQIHRPCGLLSYFISGLQPKCPRTYLCKTLEVFTSFPLNHGNPGDASVQVSQMQGGLRAQLLLGGCDCFCRSQIGCCFGTILLLWGAACSD